MFHRTHTYEPTLIHSHDSHKKEISFLGKQAIQRNSRFIKKINKTGLQNKKYFFMDNQFIWMVWQNQRVMFLHLKWYQHRHIHFADVSTRVNPTGMLGGQWVHAICDYSKLSNSTAQLADSRLMNVSSRTAPQCPHHTCVCHRCVSYPSVTMHFVSWSPNQVNGPRERKARSVTLSRETHL